VARYIVRKGSYFSRYSEQSVHRERYALCGRAIRRYLFNCRLEFLVVARQDIIVVPIALLQFPLRTLAACNNHGGQKQ
jgi:hypothetical protein